MRAGRGHRQPVVGRGARGGGGAADRSAGGRAPHRPRGAGAFRDLAVGSGGHGDVRAGRGRGGPARRSAGRGRPGVDRSQGRLADPGRDRRVAHGRPGGAQAGPAPPGAGPAPPNPDARPGAGPPGAPRARAGGQSAEGAQAVILAESGRLALDLGSDAGEPGISRLDQAVTLAAGTDSPLLLAGAPDKTGPRPAARTKGGGGKRVSGWARAGALAAGTDSRLLRAAALDMTGRSRRRQGHGPAARGAFARVTALSPETGAAQAIARTLGPGPVGVAGGSA